MNYLAKTNSGIVFGNNENQETIRFQRHYKVEITQKSANPSISVYGNDPDAMIKEIMETYDKLTREFNKRNKAVGPISS
jgi:hypothetical protein